MYFDFPSGNNATVVDLMRWSHSTTDNMFGPVIVGVIFVVFFISMKNYPTPQAFGAASFIAAISSYMMYVLGLVDSYVVLLTTLSTAYAIYALVKDDI